MNGNTKTLEHFNTITNKEIQILIVVMRKYNIELVSAEKIRGVYKVIGNKGNFCLKRMKNGRNKVKNTCILTEQLLLNKFTNTAKYFRTKDGDSYVSYKKNIFYLTEWLEGMECDLTNIDEAVNCAKLLAHFHSISNKIDRSRINVQNNSRDLPKIFASNLNDLQKFKRVITTKRIKNEFDVIFMENIDKFYNRGISAIDMLNKSQYYKSLKVANDKKIICHNSFYYQNILKNNEKYFIVDFDSIAIDLQISDLGKLIRRLMFKRSYGWDFNLAKSLIEAYSSVNRLSKEDIEIMFALIIFPHKFWKLGKKRYIKQKKWSETRYLHKLNKITSYNETQENFFQDYLSFLENFF